MRTRRIVSRGEAIYHCMSRTVNGEAFFKDREKEILRKMIWQVAGFSGVEVLTYAVMKNHFHVLVRVRRNQEVPDSELIRRYGILYPKPTKYQTATAAEMERLLAAGGAPAEAVRAQLLARMGDVSQFMKTLKQRFSTWFNKSRDRYGPLWSDRFKSVLVEGKGFPLQTMAAYIDLNAVRAGLVDDPKDYRFCGYAEAVAGKTAMIRAIRFLTVGDSSHADRAALESYRQLLFGKGAAASSGKAQLSHQAALKVLEHDKGKLPAFVLLRCRVRYFTEGAILGSREFVESHAEEWQRVRRKKSPPRPKEMGTSEAPIVCIKGCRGESYS